MKSQCEVIIERSRDEVIEKFDSTENLHKWQPTLKSTEPISGEQGKAGSTMKLVYNERGREISMMENFKNWVESS